MYEAEFRDYFTGQDWENSGNNNYLTNCPFHIHNRSKTLAVDFDTGLWVCKNPECGEAGKGIRQLENRLYHKEFIDEFKQNLEKGKDLDKDSEVKKFLEEERGISHDTSVKYGLAFRQFYDKDSLTGELNEKKEILIPIYGEQKNLVAGRRYLLPKYREENEAKIKFAWRSSPISLYPIETIKNKTIVVTEGEFDALILNDKGIPAITTTGGSGADFREFAEYFVGKKIYLCYDCDNAGKEGAKKSAKVLANLPETEVYIMDLGLADGEDVTDYFVKYRMDKESFEEVMENAVKVERYVPPTLPMSDIGAEHINKEFMVEARVMGEAGTSKYLWSHYNILECKGYDLEICQECPLNNNRKKTVVIEPNDPRVMELVEQTPVKQRNFIAAMGHIPFITNTRRCNFWELNEKSKKEIAVPVFIESSEDDTPESKRELAGYVTTEQASSKIKSGRKANFWLTPVQETRDSGQLMFIAEEVEPLQDDLDTFKISPELHEKLKVFQGNPMEKIPEIASRLNESMFRIRGREDLSIAYDLVYHSVIGIPNPNAPNRTIKGWAELLVIGDPGEGKSQMAIEMQKYYDLGAIQDAATATPGGLTVTTVQIGGKWIFRDGLLPLNDRRLVFIDEFNKLHAEDMGRLNTSRSSGTITASSSAGTYEKDARVRLVWITNPKDGQRINTGRDAGDFPISMVPDLFPDRGSQDRLDFSVVILQEDDKPEFKIPPADEEDSVYTKDLCRSLVLWAWTRRPDQIKFTKEAVKELRRVSDYLRRKFWHSNSDIELINSGERTTERIVRLATASAARTYSTADGEHLFVTEEHIQFVKEFLEKQYEKMEFENYIQSVKVRNKVAADVVEEKDSKVAHSETIISEQVYKTLNSDRLFRDMLDKGTYDATIERKIDNRNVISWLYNNGYVFTQDARVFKFTKAFYMELEPKLREWEQNGSISSTP